MKRIFILSFFVIAIVFSGSIGCGKNVCEDAEDILNSCLTTDLDANTYTSCEGADRCVAECIVNNSVGTCESFKAPEEQDAALVEAFNACVANCVLDNL